MLYNLYDRTTSLTALGAVDLVDMKIGPGVIGTLGDATGITFGACTGKLDINAPQSTAIYLKPTSWPTINVTGCSQGTGVVLVDGTITTFNAECDGVVRLNAAVNLTDLFVTRGTVYIDAGAAVTTIWVAPGATVLDSAGGWTTLYMAGGRYKALGETSLTLGTAHISGGAVAQFDAPCTIAAIRGNGEGLADFTKDTRFAKTITNGHAMRGFVLDASKGQVTASNNLRQKGGKILGIAPSTITLDTSVPA